MAVLGFVCRHEPKGHDDKYSHHDIFHLGGLNFPIISMVIMYIL